MPSGHCPIRLSKLVKTEKQRGKARNKDYAAGPGICRSGRIVRIYPAGTRPFGIQCGYKSIWTIWHIAYICPLIHVKYSEAGRMNKTKSHFKLIKRSRGSFFPQGLIWHFTCSAAVHIKWVKSSFLFGHPTKLSTFPTKKQQGNPFS